MKVEQIYELANQVTGEVLGKTDLLKADLSNVVDLGTELANLGTNAVDNYVKSLVDHIGKVVFVDRPYAGSAPSVLMDGWEFGSICEKVSMDQYPEAQKNASWDLQNGQSYDTNVFTQPKASAKFFNGKNSYEIPMSFASRQIQSAFSNATQLNAFFSMIENGIQNSMTVKDDALIMATINNMTAATLADGNANRAINVLSLYNTRFGTNLTAAQAITDKEFIRFTAYIMGLYACRLGKISTLFNIGGKERFTAPDRLHVVLLDQIAHAADAYLQSDTYHNEFVKLPNAEIVPYWQGSGTDYAFDKTSSIDISVDGDTEVKKSGIIGVMFDRDALGVTNLDRRVTSQYNAKGEFYNNWYKFDCGYFNDQNENYIVFYVADAA